VDSVPFVCNIAILKYYSIVLIFADLCFVPSQPFYDGELLVHKETGKGEGGNR